MASRCRWAGFRAGSSHRRSEPSRTAGARRVATVGAGRGTFSGHDRGPSPYDRSVDHYEVLGVPRDAEVGDIRRAYLASARRHHPDFHAADSPAAREGHAAQMKAVTEAWHVLGDPGRRQTYDERLRRGRSGLPADERERVRSTPDVPAGKGWTPRTGDDAWMDDFDTWADERDRLLPEEDEPSGGRRSVGGVVAVGLFALSVLTAFLGAVFESRAMIAVAVSGVVISSVMFILLPLVEMTRRRGEVGEPSLTKERTPFTGDSAG